MSPAKVRILRLLRASGAMLMSSVVIGGDTEGIAVRSSGDGGGAKRGGGSGAPGGAASCCASGATGGASGWTGGGFTGAGRRRRATLGEVGRAVRVVLWFRVSGFATGNC